MELSLEQKQRYARHLILGEIGAAGQARLVAARVTLAGRYAVAAAALDYLVAAGVGEIQLLSAGEPPDCLLPVIGPQPSWAAAARAVGLRLNPGVRLVEPTTATGSELAPGVLIGTGGLYVAAAAEGWTARVACGVCAHCVVEGSGCVDPFGLRGSTGIVSKMAVQPFVPSEVEGHRVIPTNRRSEIEARPSTSLGTNGALPQAALFGGATAAAEVVKIIVGLPTIESSVVTAQLDRMQFERAPLPRCDRCWSRA